MRITAALVLLTIALLNGSASAATTSNFEPSHSASELPFEIRFPLTTSSRVLFDLGRPRYSPIPLSVLNRTKCVALVNSKGAQDATGIVSCRLTPNEWTGPAFLSFHNNSRAGAGGARELLVLLMSDKALKSLTSGKLSLGKTQGSQPGPLVPKQARLREEEINADTYLYSTDSSRKLAPAEIDGSLSPDQAMTKSLYSEKADTLQVLTGHAQAPPIAAEYVTAVETFFNKITPIGIIIHHSSALPTNDRVPTSEAQIDRFHATRGFAVACSGRIYHVAYHYFILPNGKVKPGRPENCQGAHAHGYNAYLGISLAGDFSSADNPNGKKGLTQPTSAQLRSLNKLTGEIMRRYRIPAKNVLRHSDVSNTRCPGDRFPYPQFVAGLSRSAARSSVAHNKPAQSPLKRP